MHPLLEKISDIKPYTIFFKQGAQNRFFPPTRQELELFVKIITELKPRLVGFSVLSPFAHIAKGLTRLVKINFQPALVLWGGIHPTIAPQNCIREADVICRGEGEGAIAELVEALRDGKPYQAVKNLWVKDRGLIIRNPMRPLIKDLDAIPAPSYNNDSYYFIGRNKLTRDDPVLLQSSIPIETSRRCPFTCSYCVNSILKRLYRELGDYVIKRSVGNVIGEIKSCLNLAKIKTGCITFYDEDFVSEKSWLDDFVLQYRREIGLPFQIKCNPNHIAFDVLDKLTEAGLFMVNIGIQSGSDYIRNQIFHRAEKNKEIINLARKLASNKLMILYDLILNNPYETEETLKQAIALILQLPMGRFRFFSLNFFPNYPLTKKALKDGLIRPKGYIADNISKNIRLWKFIPRFSSDKKQILQNIIWLVSRQHILARHVFARKGIINYAVFGNSSGSRLCLSFLNFIAFISDRFFRFFRNKLHKDMNY
ncbi:MAG: B12-binding domain-containing radical SAM protein [Candidatus Omnitrophica bacterium]|nr:B12-binding domain-containing radical SAM protein [Candidatus Omnitrophota bacterium]MBU1923206.1 B12-binding domain-containing radical SAM protein [Candidatus Omnitrophota bacterium]